VTAKDLCQSLDGDLKIISSKDKGTVVTFTVMVTDHSFKKMMHQQLAEDPKKKSAKSKESNNKDLSNSCYINLDTSQTS